MIPICPKCNVPFTVFLDTTLTFRLGFTQKITKAVLRKKGIQIVAGDWSKARIYCNCGALVPKESNDRTNDNPQLN